MTSICLIHVYVYICKKSGTKPLINQSSERPVRSESLKLWKNKFTTVKNIVVFFLWFLTDSEWTKYCNMKSIFYKTRGVYKCNQWNYFQRGCMDKWRSGDFSIQTWCIILEAFASKAPHSEILKRFLCMYKNLLLFILLFCSWNNWHLSGGTFYLIYLDATGSFL